MELYRPPELFCGFSRRRGSGPTHYPVACNPQAWASAMPFAVLDACLGLTLDSARNEIRFDRPLLPDFISELDIFGLSLGNGRVDVTLRRYPENVGVEVHRHGGHINIVVAK